MTDMSLGGLRDAAGLTARERDVVERLVRSLRGHAAHNRKLNSYYEGTFKVSEMGIKVDPKLLSVSQVCHWPEKAVDALADRVKLTGFAGGEQALALARDTGLASAYSSHLVDKYVNGCMFCVVGRGPKGPMVRFHDALSATALPSSDHDPSAVDAGMAVARTEVTEWSGGIAVPTVVNVLLPNRVVAMRQVAPGDWAAESHTVPERSPMIVAFAHRPRGRQPFGKTRVSRAVRSISDEMVRTMFRMEVLSAFYTMPQRYAIGLTKKQFDQLVNMKAETYADAMFLATKDADGDVPHYGQLPANSPEPFIAQARFLAGQFAGATGVPLNSLGIVQDNPSSAEAITAAREDMCLIASRDIESDKLSLARVLRLLVALDENTSTDRLTDEQSGVEVSFAEPVLTSMAGRMDAVTKLNSVVPGFGMTTVGMRMAGLDDAQIMDVRAELRQQQGMALAVATMQARAAEAQGADGAS